jgi:ferric-dicitrate binding protein FerR (iron transport regulator)
MYRWFHVAAAGLLFFMLGSLVTWFSGRKSEPSVIAQEATEIICPYGSKSKIILPDGSEVWLNAGSSLRYENNFNKDKRDVSLVGEAFFTVTTNKEKPFIVNTKGMVVRAFGTEFNVKSYPEEKSESAILVEGKIDVEIKNTGKESDIFNLKPNERLVLRSEKVEITSQTETNSNPQKRIETTPVKVDYITNIKPVLYTSWKDEQWIIESEPLETLVPMLERRYNMKFRFVNDDLKKFKFTGTLQNETIDQIMEALRMTAPIEYKIVKDSVTLRLDEKLSKQYSRIISRK